MLQGLGVERDFKFRSDPADTQQREHDHGRDEIIRAPQGLDLGQ